jgi:hypothetical protein
MASAEAGGLPQPVAGSETGSALGFGEGEGVGEELVVRRLASFKVDGEDVEAGGDIAAGELAEVVAGEAAEGAALIAVDSELGRGDGAGGAGFDFDEAEGVAMRIGMPRDEVEVAGGAGGAPAAGDDDVSVTAEPEEGGALTAESGFEVRCAGGQARTAVQGFDGGFEEIEA